MAFLDGLSNETNYKELINNFFLLKSFIYLFYIGILNEDSINFNKYEIDLL
jgi:hypothetical protein